MVTWLYSLPTATKWIYNGEMDEASGKTPEVAEAARQTGLPASVVLVLAHLDPRAFGVALGLVTGLWLWVATLILVTRGGEVVGPNLVLLSQYFAGYRVTLVGSFIGFFYASVVGFILGYAFAWTRNFLIHFYLIYVRRRAEQEVLSDLLDRMT